MQFLRLRRSLLQVNRNFAIASPALPARSPALVGDYWAGPSHTLPTGSRARFSSALTSNDFIKSISLIEYTAEQLAAAADDIIRLAQTEGLDAHARSVQIRRER
jgi:histidinol dehydrogenase